MATCNGSGLTSGSRRAFESNTRTSDRIPIVDVFHSWISPAHFRPCMHYLSQMTCVKTLLQPKWLAVHQVGQQATMMHSLAYSIKQCHVYSFAVQVEQPHSSNLMFKRRWLQRRSTAPQLAGAAQKWFPSSTKLLGRLQHTGYKAGRRCNIDSCTSQVLHQTFQQAAVCNTESVLVWLGGSHTGHVRHAFFIRETHAMK